MTARLYVVHQAAGEGQLSEVIKAADSLMWPAVVPVNFFNSLGL